MFAFVDDYSRVIVGRRFGFAEDTVRLAAALRPALSARGVPESVYVDNGSDFVDIWLQRACASLAIRLTHSKPGRRQGRTACHGPSLAMLAHAFLAIMAADAPWQKGQQK
ncbi:transposase family protein [Streptomyces sp. Ru72]|uniref:integrase catalytic domain-containing protein n=1 Tax=Streptomyces sp. Ru72 TaxID=2080747 RepID=UPI0026A482C6|nr:transposase family protein [Streptomyces sp. Ru72]